SRTFSAANTASLLMFFGMFGSIFLLAQFFQVVQHYSPFQAGLRTLPWTIMPIFVAPTAGLLSTRTGARPLIVSGLALQAVALAWLSIVVTPTVEYLVMAPAFVIAGIGMGLFFAPIANVVLSAVRRDEEGKASGANNAIREIGGVFGVAVLAAIFAANGSYATGQAFVDGMLPALRVGAVVVAIGAVAALALGSRVRATATESQAAAPIERDIEIAVA
ncbi:MAG: MFS transporter, partial [Candidatus Limnocylindrales bacterium]